MTCDMNGSGFGQAVRSDNLEKSCFFVTFSHRGDPECCSIHTPEVKID